MGCAHFEHFVRHQPPIDGIVLISLFGYLLRVSKVPNEIVISNCSCPTNLSCGQKNK
jgi:hypothetical protein